MYLSYRHRLLDVDNVFTKYVTDALVDCGVYEDDTPNIVTEVRSKQIKIANTEEEYTLIEIREAENYDTQI